MSGVKNEKKSSSRLKSCRATKFIIYESPKFDVDNIKITDEIKKCRQLYFNQIMILFIIKMAIKF